MLRRIGEPGVAVLLVDTARVMAPIDERIYGTSSDIPFGGRRTVRRKIRARVEAEDFKPTGNQFSTLIVENCGGTSEFTEREKERALQTPRAGRVVWHPAGPPL